ncbi:hypothetical protein D3C81_2119920 [compost metagenome]
MKNTAKVPDAPGKIMPQNEFIRPFPPLPKKSLPPANGIWRMTYTVGIMVTMPGIIIAASSTRKMGLFSLNFSFAKA